MFKVHCTVALCILTLESLGNNTAMMQITEDTPPDMLAGAMDLTIHLPTSRTVKMSVERSTPMMDLLVQITTAHHLQHSGHILQALEMGSTSGPTDKILPYKPNTPIGSLETQHVKVVSKNRTNSVPKTSAIGQQPFESTFRLQVHLPRNQLYVIRVSQYVFLEDIMKKVCDEKNLDIRKYEFRHPGHLDEVLDPKLTLSDYQITEVYLVAKGTAGLSQTFSSNDIMALKKEEERKQLQARTGGGVFNLIFKRGKSSFGSGSVSSDTRSISPSHSDDSRSVTPPGIQQQILPVTQQQSPITEKPKPPQRKRRPAPKPPQQNLPNSKPSSQISTISDSNTSELQQKGSENGLTICHSRNSSDSSGYHEPSVLSDNCNLSLPRRTKPNIINEVVNEESQSSESNRSSTGNLSNMLKFSKSTTSIASRKKKAAPPPPSLLQSQSLVEKPSPVVASPIVEAQVEISSVEETHLDGLVSPDISEQASTPDLEADEKTFPVPLPRTKHKTKLSVLKSKPVELDKRFPQVQNSATISEESKTVGATLSYNKKVPSDSELFALNNVTHPTNASLVPNYSKSTSEPHIVALIPKSCGNSPFLSISSQRKFNKRMSLSNVLGSDYKRKALSSKSASHIPSMLDDYEVNDFNLDMFKCKPVLVRQKKVSQERHGIYDLEFDTNRSSSNPCLMEMPGIRRWSNMQDLDDLSIGSDFHTQKWVVGGDSDTDSLSTIPTKQSAPASISSSIASTPSHLSKTKTFTNSVIPAQNGELTSSVDRPQIKYMQNPTPPDIYPSKPTYENSGTFEYPKGNFTGPETELENEWQYQLPSPPTAFRDLSPTNMTDVTNYDTVTLEEFKGDSVITNPMLFEKLERVKDRQSEIETVSDVNSTLSEEERPMLNKLTLENLEKRKSLVYNRELSTSLKIAQNSNTNHTRSEDRVHGSHSDVINELEDIIHHGRSKTLSRHNSCADDYNAAFDRHLPNFQISTYDKPKSKINIFEDDSVRSNVEIPVKDEVPYDNLRQTSENSAVENDTFKKPQEFGKYKALTRSNFFVKNNHAPTNIMRSESFSSSNHNIYKWKPQNPVQRSKSQVALNDYKELTEDGTECLTRSNSLLDVPGLQSLEVMRMIQTKLGNSTEHIFEKEVQSTPPPLIEEDKPDSTLTTKTYRYQGPPSINLSTWSERPKTKVSLKEDKDYRSNDTFSPEKSNNVSIKVNGVETIKSTTPGNVIIKIGESESKSNTFSSRFLNHYAGVGYRKPLSNVNKIGNIGRPHSIAMDLDIDISRVPVVRSVELKKPLKEVNNKSVTQINSNELVNNIRNKFVEMPEPANKVCSTNNESCNEADSLPKPVNRINSFAQSRYGPTVVGFRSVDNDNESVRRRSWNLSNTLPSKISADHSTKTYTTNTNVPFSQVTLKRVESNKVSSGNDADTTDSRLNGKTTLYNTYSSGNIYSLESEVANTNIPPPPPTIPKITNTKRKSVKTFEPVTDPRDDLLNSIRSFGGIKGLKHVKV
ncbi:uncharacterized protein LOC116172580 isoform X3 [Photinus pyralis]|uniref:uncharacterized protein LOC116172580 isoform X3 n=1 Tax=Photinus pyralis TaxID=7054 RepID=UPI0012670EA3|nr:uncharacterized protein LOC116172580 isoform X3 [Photinus pyralis]